MIYIVYCTTNIKNKKIYIGVHKCVDDSFDGYIGCGVYSNKPNTYNHPKTHFQYAVQKYGPDSFKRITIKKFDNEEDAYNLEADIVNESFLQRKDVYNQALGGIGGDIRAYSKPCYQYDLNGNFIAEYKSQQEASIENKCGFTTIKRAIREKIKAINYFWSEEKVEILDLNLFKTTDNKILVFQYSESGEYDCCYESVSDAARVNNCTPTNISRACKLGYKVGNKYFSYEFEERFDKANKNFTVRNKKVYQYSLNGEYLNEYENCRQAELAIGAKSSGLNTAIKLGRTFNNFQWSLEKLDKLDSIEIKCSARKVGQYDLNGNLVKIFNTVSECTKEFSGCRHVLSGKRKTSGGFTFKYIQD